jgi:hypothetical protein
VNGMCFWCVPVCFLCVPAVFLVCFGVVSVCFGVVSACFCSLVPPVPFAFLCVLDVASEAYGEVVGPTRRCGAGM